MSTNTNAVLSRTSSTNKRKADDDGVPTKKKTIKRKPTTGLIINSGPAPIIRTSSALSHTAPSASRPATALAQHPRTSHTPPTSDGESSRRPPTRQPPASPPVPAIVAARARGESIPPADPTPVRAPRTGSVIRTTAPSQSFKGKGKARIPGLGLPERSTQPVEEDPSILEEDRWMAGQRSELDARERDNQRRAGNPPASTRISALNFGSSATGSTPVQRKPSKPRPPAPNHSGSSSSVLSRVMLDSVQPVPISNTPVIVRNREIRQASQSRRRSSLSSRATPHPSVPPDTFYRHVDPDLPDALRLRQVLCWTASRASDRPISSTTDPDPPAPSPLVTDLLKSIQATAIKRIASGQINTAISSQRPPDAHKRLAPNPRNTINAQAISRLEAYNQACQAEDSAWSELIAAYNSQQAQVVAALASSPDKEKSGEVELDEQWKGGIQLVKEVLRTVKEGVGDDADDEAGLSDGEREIVHRIRALEPAAYDAYESAYRATQFTAMASTHLEHVFGTLAATLRQRTAPTSALAPRDETARMLGVAPASGVDAMDLLRALSTREASAGSGVGAKRVNGIKSNEALQKVTPVVAVPTPRKPPGTPRASRGSIARSKKR